SVVAIPPFLPIPKATFPPRARTDIAAPTADARVQPMICFSCRLDRPAQSSTTDYRLSRSTHQLQTLRCWVHLSLPDNQERRADRPMPDVCRRMCDVSIDTLRTTTCVDCPVWRPPGRLAFC